MSDLEVFAVLLVALVLCVANWRVGLSVCVLVGFIQDPLRKLTLGEPVYLTALVGAPLLATLIGAHLRKVPISFRPVHSWNGVLRTPLNLFILLVGIQSIATVVRTGIPTIGAIGALSYLAPLPAILLGYQFSRSERDISKLIKVYLVVGVLMVSGIYLSYAGYDWQILKSVGEGLFIYSMSKGRLDLYSGFLRSPEIAAWHAAACVCLLIVMSLSLRRSAVIKWSSGAAVVFLIGTLLLTGRRKFLVEIFVFASIYAFLLIWFRGAAFKSALLSQSSIVLAAGLFLASVGYMYFSTDVATNDIRPYYERGASVGNDVTERVSVMTIESFGYVIAQNGIFGSGAGTGSQGTQHFGKQTTGGAAEGGLAKVLAELGIPGLLLLLWLVISLARYMWSIIRFITSTRDVDPVQSKLIFGLVAFLITNGFVYAIAHQVFGDPFVLIILGFFTGFVLAMPKMQPLKAKDGGQTNGNRAQIGDLRSLTGSWSPSPISVHSSPGFRPASLPKQ